MKSMTGFGRAAGEAGGFAVTVEIKSVNSRFLDLTLRLPRGFSCVEDRIRPLLQSEGITRGKVEVSLTATGGAAAALTVNGEAAAAYVSALRELRDRFSLPDDITVTRVAENKDIFETASVAPDPDRLFEALRPILHAAVDGLLARRAAEGERLWVDLSGKLNGIRERLAKIADRSEANAKGCLQKLSARIREVLADCRVTPDENRLLTEAALAVDRMAIDEELVRLETHINGFEEIAAAGEPAGRKLDFLLQEMNREANTIGSKCDDAIIAREVVEIKCELEKIREQIQNIE